MITCAEVNNLSPSSFVPNLMNCFKICAEVLVPKSVYPQQLWLRVAFLKNWSVSAPEMLLKIQKSADVKYEIDKYFDILYVRVCSSFSRLHTSYIHTQNKNSTRA